MSASGKFKKLPVELIVEDDQSLRSPPGKFAVLKEKTEGARSVLRQAWVGLVLLFVGISGLVATISLTRGFRNNDEVFKADRALHGDRSLKVLAGATMTVLGWSISNFFCLLHKVWVEHQLELGINPSEVIWAAKGVAGWFTLVMCWCLTGVAKCFPSARSFPQAGILPTWSTICILSLSVISPVVLSGPILVPILLKPEAVEAEVTIAKLNVSTAGANGGVSDAITIPNTCNVVTSYINSSLKSENGWFGTYDWKPLKLLEADGEDMWVRNIFDSRTIDVKDELDEQERNDLEKQLKEVLNGEEYAMKDGKLNWDNILSNAVLFANGERLNACTARALNSPKVHSMNQWLVEHNKTLKIHIGVASGSWSEKHPAEDAIKKEKEALTEFADPERPDCINCWGKALFADDDMLILLDFGKEETGSGELVVVLKTGQSQERFSLRAAMLQVTAEFKINGDSNRVTGSLKVQNATIDSVRFTKTFACNIVNTLVHNQLSVEVGRRCLAASQSDGKWYADTKSNGNSATRLLRNAARLAPFGNAEEKGVPLQLPGTVSAILGFTMKMELTKGSFNESTKEGAEWGYGLRPAKVTVNLAKMEVELYMLIVLLEILAASLLLVGSLWVVRVTRFDSVNVDPYLFLGRLSMEEKHRLALTDDKVEKEWLDASKLTLIEADGHILLTRQKLPSSKNDDDSAQQVVVAHAW